MPDYLDRSLRNIRMAPEQAMGILSDLFNNYGKDAAGFLPGAGLLATGMQDDSR